MNIKDRIKQLSSGVALQLGVEFVDLELAGSARRATVRIFIEKEGGVTLEDCARFSRALAAVMDVEDPVKTAYVLEVSSPGLDRPLRTNKDFSSSTGKLARIVTREKIGDASFFVGRIVLVTDEAVTIHIESNDGSTEVIIPFKQISKARLEIELP